MQSARLKAGATTGDGAVRPANQTGMSPMKSSELLLQQALRPRLDRRRARLFLAPCRDCGDTAPVVVSRTPYVIYVRCCACASVARKSLSIPLRSGPGLSFASAAK